MPLLVILQFSCSGDECSSGDTTSSSFDIVKLTITPPMNSVAAGGSASYTLTYTSSRNIPPGTTTNSYGAAGLGSTFSGWIIESPGKWTATVTMTTTCATPVGAHAFKIVVGGIRSVTATIDVTSTCSAPGLQVNPTTGTVSAGNILEWSLIRTVGKAESTPQVGRAATTPTVMGLPAGVLVSWHGTGFTNNQWAFSTKVDRTAVVGTYPFTVSYQGQTANASMTITAAQPFGVTSWEPKTMSASACMSNFQITFTGSFPNGSQSVTTFKTAGGTTWNPSISAWTGGVGEGPSSLTVWGWACPVAAGDYIVRIDGTQIGTFTITP